MLWSNHRRMQNHIPEETNLKLHSCKNHKIQNYLVQVNNSRQTCAPKIRSLKCCKISTLHGTATFWVTFIKMPAFKSWHDWSVTGMAECAAIHWQERYKSGTNGLRGFTRVRSFLQNRIGEVFIPAIWSHFGNHLGQFWNNQSQVCLIIKVMYLIIKCLLFIHFHWNFFIEIKA